MKPFRYFFIGLTLIGLFLAAAGGAGSHGHFESFDLSDILIFFGTPVIGLVGLFFTYIMNDKIHKDSVKSRVQSSKEFYELMESLNRAVDTLKKVNGGQSIEFESADRFAVQLKSTTDKLQRQELIELKKLWTWFSPTGPWDEFVGEEGIQLGTKIFDLTEKLKKMTN